MKTLASVPIACFGIWMVTLGWSRFQEASALGENGVSVTGVVVSRTHVTSGMGSVPKIDVSFTTADGTRRTVRYTGDDPVGSRVKVLYDPAHPDRSSAASVSSMRGVGVLLLVSGGLFAVGTPYLFGRLALAEARR